MPRPSPSSQEPVWWKPFENPQVASDQPSKLLSLGATIREPDTNLTMRVYCNAPGIHLYTGNFLNGQLTQQAAKGKGGVLYPQYGGFCFETQAFPNAVNTPAFPSVIVRPGQLWNNRLSYDFSCK
jgi:aldose 1-epimerase